MSEGRAETPVTGRRSVSQPFRPRARVPQLLGDELIGSARLAVFELVKNAYDADASEAIVRLNLDSVPEPTITVTDDGDGMTLETLRSVWLVPGSDHRREQRLSERRTARHGRLPLGEKGLGRFAVHKLGDRITLVTRAYDTDECVVDIDWNKLIEQRYLDEAPVRFQVRSPQVFTEDRTGTRIEIRHLRTHWTRGEVRRLHNQNHLHLLSIRRDKRLPGRAGGAGQRNLDRRLTGYLRDSPSLPLEILIPYRKRHARLELRVPTASGTEA